MKPTDLLSARREELESIVSASIQDASAHSLGFSRRVLGQPFFGSEADAALPDPASTLDHIVYGGYPEAAYLGFSIGGRPYSEVPTNVIDSFVSSMDRLSGRTGTGLQDFASDDVAVLGIADGVSSLVGWNTDKAPGFAEWLRNLINEYRAEAAWSVRARDLAADLLDHRGRLRTTPQETRLEELTLDLCLREAWPDVFLGTTYPNETTRELLLSTLLAKSAPEPGDLERSSVWLKSLDLLVRQAAQSLVTSTEGVIRLLKNTQSALRRWVWEETARRKGRYAARWVIDNEYHVQSLLWTILYPIFSSDLRDEQYLPGYGLAQPRYDLGIVSLKLIIEVKFVRQKSDFKAVEEQIAGDLGLYFEDLDRFNRLIVYIYDDCDTQHPELYDVLRSVLMQRDQRIVDVVFVRRPGMMPARGER